MAGTAGATRDRGSALVTAGGVLFLVGVAAVVAVVVPLVTGSARLPVAVYLVTALAPVGLGLALVGMLLARAAATRRPPGDRPASPGTPPGR